MTVSRVEDGSEFDSTKTLDLYRNSVKRICHKQLKKRKSNIVLSIYSIYQMFLHRSSSWFLVRLEILVSVFPELWWRK